MSRARTTNVRGCCTLFIKTPIAPIANARERDRERGGGGRERERERQRARERESARARARNVGGGAVNGNTPRS